MPRGGKTPTIRLGPDGSMLAPDGYATIREIVEGGLIPKTARSLQFACKRYTERVAKLHAEGVTSRKIEEPESDELKCLKIRGPQGPIYFVEIAAISKHFVHRTGGKGQGRGRVAGTTVPRRERSSVYDDADGGQSGDARLADAFERLAGDAV